MRRLSVLAVLLALAWPAAALPEPLTAVLTELEGSTQADEAFGQRLQRLKDALDAYGNGMTGLDPRRTRAMQLSVETASLKTRAGREGVMFRELRRDLLLHVAAVRELDVQPVGAPVPRLTPGADTGYLAQLQDGGARALSLITDDPFGTLRDGLNVPGVSPLLGYAGAPRRPAPEQRPPLASALPETVPLPRQAPLRRGFADESRVNALQEQLNVWRRATGYRIIDKDGDFGPKTHEAVVIFQRENGLEANGVVDEATAAALTRAADAARGDLSKYVQLGDQSPAVEHAQMLLNRVAGFKRLKEDGDFGGFTQRAVRAFQRSQRLPPSGHVDRETLAALEREAASKPAPGARGNALMAPAGPTDLYTSRRMPANVSGWIAQAEQRYGIEPHVYRAVVWAEGGALLPAGRGNGAGAYGPAQITQSGAGPCIGRRFNGQRVTWDLVKRNWAVNVDCGAFLFKDRWNLPGMPDDAGPLIIASTYNTRARNWASIIRNQKVPQIRETTYYVTRISRIHCQWTGRQLLVPNRDLHPNATRQWRWALDADRDMVNEIEDEGREARPGCAHSLDAASRTRVADAE